MLEDGKAAREDFGLPVKQSRGTSVAPPLFRSVTQIC